MTFWEAMSNNGAVISAVTQSTITPATCYTSIPVLSRRRRLVQSRALGHWYRLRRGAQIASPVERIAVADHAVDVQVLGVREARTASAMNPATTNVALERLLAARHAFHALVAFVRLNRQLHR